MLVAIILPLEAHFALVDCKQSFIRDCDAMGIAAQIFERLLRTAEWRFGINDPVPVFQRSSKTKKGDGIPKRLRFAEEVEFPLVESVFQGREEQAAKQTRQHAYGQEEARQVGYPALMIRTDATARNHAMNMRMVLQVLAPGMKDGEEADLCAEMLRVARNGE